jgi:hypothetical protein
LEPPGVAVVNSAPSLLPFDSKNSLFLRTKLEALQLMQPGFMLEQMAQFHLKHSIKPDDNFQLFIYLALIIDGRNTFNY